MRPSIFAAAAAVAFLPSAAAFLPASPLQQRSIRPTATIARRALSPEVLDATSNLVAIVKENDVFVKQVGEYPWGSVQAPEWALPVAAIATLSFGVLIPLILKPGVDAFNAGENAGRSKAVETTTVLKGGKAIAGKTTAKPLAASPKASASKTPISATTASSSKKAAPAAASSSKKWGLF